VEKPNFVIFIVYGYIKYLLEQSIRQIGSTSTISSYKFRLLVKSSLLLGLRQKSARASPRHLAHNIPDFIQIGSISAEL